MREGWIFLSIWTPYAQQINRACFDHARSAEPQNGLTLCSGRVRAGDQHREKGIRISPPRGGVPRAGEHDTCGSAERPLLEMAATWEKLAAERSAFVRRHPELAIEDEHREELLRQEG
jgi:hypothetical protein